MSTKHQVGKTERNKTRVNITIPGTPDTYVEARQAALDQIHQSHGLGPHRKSRKPIRVRTVRLSKDTIERTFIFEV